VFPPARTMAIVEFLVANDAKAAFRHLAYKRFKNSLLYLEYAPVGVFKDNFNPDKHNSAIVGEKKLQTENEPVKSVSASELKADEEKDTYASESVTIFVKNLNFDTTEDTLHTTFSSIEGLRSASIRYKFGGRNKEKKLSQGFGFVEYNSKENAMKAIKSLQVNTVYLHRSTDVNQGF
jgi:multiple RNA-binding domain-containing protein 1